MKMDRWTTLPIVSFVFRLITLTCIFICITCGPPAAMAQSNTQRIKIKETIWAFNGKVQPGQFNPVSILIDNETSDAIDGIFLLQKSDGLLSKSGPVYQQSVFIGASGRRWVQFYAYVAEDYRSQWQLRLLNNQTGKTSQIGKVQQPAATQQSTQEVTQASDFVQAVVMLPSDSAARVPSNVKRYPEEIFPPYSTATTALHTVFLDHSPDWEEPRQKAFMDWVRLGGNVHILQTRSGQYPKFTDELTSLDQPLPSFNVGLGRVQRLNIGLKDLSEQAAETAIREGLTLDRRIQIVGTANSEGELEDINDQQATFDSSPSGLDMQMFRQMQEQTQPQHAWWLIFLLAVIYVLLIFPGCYLLSKNRQLHFLTTYAAITGLSLVFSIIFLFIGQRGYGESTWLQTLAIAKVADNGDLAVQRWNTLFVTSGDQYQLSSSDSQSLMNAGVTGDNTVASVVPGKDATTNVRIPPYSSQSLNSTQYVSAKPWKLTVTERQMQFDQLIRLKIQADDSFPQTDSRSRFYVITGAHIQTLKYDAKTKQLNLFGSRQFIADFCQIRNDFRFIGWGANNRQQKSSDKDKLYLDEAIPSMVHRSLLVDHIAAPSYLSVPPDRIRLLVLTALPEDLDLKINAEARRTGWILYTRDLLTNQ